MTGTLIENLYLAALPTGCEGPAASPQGFDREGGRPAVEQELPQRRAWDRVESGRVGLTGNSHLVTVYLNLDHLAIDENGVSHTGSRTATVSTWVV